MKTFFIFRSFCFGCLLFLVACQSENKKVPANLSPEAHAVTAEEVIQASNYTYVRVSAEGRDYWTAISKAEIKTGQTYYWSQGTLMKNFSSKELNRVFDNILFISDFTDQPITTEATAPDPHQGEQQPPITKKEMKLSVADGGITIAELFANRDKYSGKKVKIKGEVMKFSGQIMGKNWVHLQDGTADGSNFDLTITSNEFVGLGEIVVFEGIVGINRDFGAGYSYEVIVEEAKVIR